jgi:hypothetical protein
VRCLYLDLDGTLLGRGGSLLHDGDGTTSLLAVRALEACLRADVEVVLMSGRRQETVAGPARLFGQTAYIFEVGSCLVLDGEEHWLTGDLQPGEQGSIFEQVEAMGAPDLLLEHFAGRLEYHEPWHRDRDVSHLFRGDIDAFEADELLADHGFGHLRLVDNGGIHPIVPGFESFKAYHLVPAMASKANGVAFHMRVRGYTREDCIAIGDSREDLGAAAVVRTFWLVANGVERDPTITAALTPNTRVCEERNGAGVYEAIISELSERGA